MSNETGKVMKRKNPYMVLDVTPFRDTRLSWKAKGLMTYFLDKPEGWKFYLEHIYTQAPDRKKSVASGLAELKRYGYIVRVAFRKNEKVDHYQFLIYEQPVAYPTEKDLHINLEQWEAHLENGGDIDITLVSQKGKPAKPLENTLVSQKEVPAFQQPEKEVPAKEPLVINKGINSLSLSSTYDDDGSANWEKDHSYQLLRQMFTVSGFDDIKKPENHYSKFLEALNGATIEKMIEKANKYIQQVKQGKHEHEKAQIVWFLAGGWKNNFDQQREKASKKSNQQEKKLPKSVAKQIQQQEEQVDHVQADLAEKQARIQAKLKMMNERFGARDLP